MTTMTATMTTAYIAKLAEALRKNNQADETDRMVLPLSCPGIINAQVGGCKDSLISRKWTYGCKERSSRI